MKETTVELQHSSDLLVMKIWRANSNWLTHKTTHLDSQQREVELGRQRLTLPASDCYRS